MSENNAKRPDVAPSFTREQIAAISGLIVKRAFDKIERIEAQVESYFEKYIDAIIIASLGIEPNRWSSGGYTLHQTNSFSGPLLRFIKARATKKAVERIEGVVERWLIQDQFKQYVTAELKKAFSSVYDDAYKREMESLIKAHMIINDNDLKDQIDKMIADTCRNATGAAKATMETYLLCATDDNEARR